MLQQTQVVTAVPYYLRFLQRFPTVEALAAASLDDVLLLWQGLGYYTRARNLHGAAKLVQETYGGALPTSSRELRALPGIGDYTAAAVASIAYGEHVAAIDANVTRVLARLHDLTEDVQTAAAKCALRQLAGRLLPPGRPDEGNQALMELGAIVCRPHAPRCSQCPVAAQCAARMAGTQESRPARRTRPVTAQRVHVAGLLRRDGRVLLVRRVPRGLLGGLWELPGTEVSWPQSPSQALTRWLGQSLALDIIVGRELARLRHTYTHFSLEVHVLACETRGEPRPTGMWDAARWLARAELCNHGLTGVTTKALRLVE